MELCKCEQRVGNFHYVMVLDFGTKLRDEMIKQTAISPYISGINFSVVGTTTKASNDYIID